MELTTHDKRFIAIVIAFGFSVVIEPSNNFGVKFMLYVIALQLNGIFGALVDE